MRCRNSFVSLIVASLLAGVCATGQTPSAVQLRARIVEQIDDSRTVTLSGNIHPLVASSPSQPVDESTPMEHMILFLKGDPSQDTQLARLVAQQNDPESPLFHRFLTPESFGSQFGVADADLKKITTWLQNHGFNVEELPPGHRAIVFSGNSGQVAETFQTQIRRYNVAGVDHYANATDPQIPSALVDVVAGIVKLHDFRHERSISHLTSLPSSQWANPQFDATGGGHYLAPADYATIYHINPLYTAGVNGTGQTIAVLARSNIALSDVANFRSSFGLPARNPQIVIANGDPGILAGDSTETSLDTEWSGAVAPAATVKVIVAASTNTADGIDLSALYAVNNNVAPVVSLSYGSCESSMGNSELGFYNSLWQQAAAQGMSVMVSAGDSGASCGPLRGVNGLCSSPYSTCVGGTEFVEGNNPGQYWLPGNNSVYGSASGYIPETVWNESGSNGGSGLWSGGGGMSMAFTKPAWQTGPGVPADGHRDVPDVALTAAGHDAYLVVQSGSLMAIGGTSASAPSFAGLMALVDQQMNTRQGLANSVLYPLAINQAAGGAAVFHDITSGNNSVPGVTGFPAKSGYDQASGLGSVDATLLVNHWADPFKSTLPSISLSASATALTVSIGQSAQTNVTASTGKGLASAVTLAVTGAPAGVSATLRSTVLPAPGSGTVGLAIAVAASAKPGAYSLNVSAVGGAQTANLALSLTIPVPTFTLSAVTAPTAVMAGNTAQIPLGTVPQNGFNAPISFSVASLPPGISASFLPPTVNGGVPSADALLLAVAKTVKPGSYALSITATGGGVTQSSSVTLVTTVAGTCTLTANPASLKLTAGQAATLAVSCGSVQGTLNGPLTLSASGLPGGVTVRVATPSIAAGASTTLSIATATSTVAGSYTLSLTATATGFSQTLAIPVVIAAVPANPNFTFALNTSSLTIQQGGAAGTVIVSTGNFTGGFNSTITLRFSGLAVGMNYAATGATTGNNLVNVSEGVTASAATPPGTYPVTITATGAGITHSAVVQVTVTKAAAQAHR